MRFDLIDLRLFLNVHETGTITAAAQASHMTLASASERIRGMEDTIATPLLIRDPRGVRVTPAGRALVHHARLVLTQIDQMHNELSDYGAGLRGHVRLLCNTSALSEHLPDVVSSFLTEHARISIELEERTSIEIVDAIRNRTCDVGVVADSVDLEGLECLELRPDPLIVAIPRDHPLSRAKSVSFSEIIAYPFVGLGAGSALHEHLTQHARRLGKSLDYRVRLRSFDAISRVVGRGVGLAVMPKAVCVRYARSAGIKMLPLSDPWAKRKLMVGVRDMQELPDHVRQLIHYMLSRESNA